MVLALVFGGALVGLGCGLVIAPGSVAAPFLGFLMLPFSFIAGMFAWFWLAFGWALGQLMVDLVRRHSLRAVFASGPREGSPAGSWVFVPLSSTVCGTCGFAAGLEWNTPMFPTWPAFTALGSAYGLLLTTLARRGILPLLAPEG